MKAQRSERAGTTHGSLEHPDGLERRAVGSAPQSWGETCGQVRIYGKKLRTRTSPLGDVLT